MAVFLALLVPVVALPAPAAAFGGGFDDYGYGVDDPFGDSSWSSDVLGADDWASGDLLDGDTEYMVGGEPAASGPIHRGPMAGFSYQVSIRVMGHHECGGTLIAQDWVLTAGHCVAPGKSYTIEFGSLNRRGGQQAQVVSTHVHPQFRNPAMGYDIALMRMSPAAPLNLVRAALPTDAIGESMARQGVPVLLSGWGVTTPQQSPSGGQLADNLKEMRLETMDMSSCSSVIGEGSTDLWVCAGPVDGSSNSPCFGDSGGPLIAAEGGKPYIVGIVSWGKHCTGPALYTKVSKYRSWIEQTMSRSGGSPSSGAGALPPRPAGGVSEGPAGGVSEGPAGGVSEGPVEIVPESPFGGFAPFPIPPEFTGCGIVPPWDPVGDFLLGLELLALESEGEQVNCGATAEVEDSGAEYASDDGWGSAYSDDGWGSGYSDDVWGLDYAGDDAWYSDVASDDGWGSDYWSDWDSGYVGADAWGWGSDYSDDGLGLSFDDGFDSVDDWSW